MLISMHETGIDCRDTVRTKGYRLRGKPARSQKLLVRGEHISALCLTSIEGMLACKIARGSVNGNSFIEFVENLVMPNLMPLDGYNPRRVLIMDNC